MKISIRESECNGMTRLLVYRPRERQFSLPGSAYETASGFWVLHIPNKPADVVANKAQAAAALEAFYANKS